MFLATLYASQRGSLQGGKHFDSNFLCLLCVACNSKQLSKKFSEKIFVKKIF